MSAGALIVGAGQAGLQIAASLRQHGYAEPITITGAESHAPYQRPPLSKTFLAGTVTADSLALRTAAFYEAKSINIKPAELVEDLDLSTGLATSSSGRTFDFEHLALTTGARVRRMAVPGHDLPGIHYLRDQNDASALAADLSAARRVVVVGGGFIGLETASVARALGKSVTVIESLDRLLARAVAPVVSDFFLSAHRRRGVEIILGRGVVAFKGTAQQRVSAVVLDDETMIQADLVVIGIGVIPRIELAVKLGLEVGTGIRVDDQARTSDLRVVAAGDVTESPHPRLAGAGVRLESVQNAINQAQAAAASILGLPPPDPQLPWFWSDQGTIKLQIAGFSGGYDQVVVRGDRQAESFSALYFAEGRLIAADCVNRAQDFMAVRRALSTGKSIDPDAGATDSRPLKELLDR